TIGESWALARRIWRAAPAPAFWTPWWRGGKKPVSDSEYRRILKPAPVTSASSPSTPMASRCQTLMRSRRSRARDGTNISMKIQLIGGIGELVQHYDGFILDLWGV